MNVAYLFNEIVNPGPGEIFVIFLRDITRNLFSIVIIPFVNSPHKGPVTRKMLPFDDVIME